MLTKKDNIKNEVKSNKIAKDTSQPSAAQESHSHNGCCQPTKTTTQPPAKSYSPQPTKLQYDAQTDRKSSSKTRVTIKYDAGFPNQLYIRGKGANLSWDKGQPLKNTHSDEWVWESDVHFNHCEFKILINDKVYENGDNHHLNAGSTLLYTPHFY